MTAHSTMHPSLRRIATLVVAVLIAFAAVAIGTGRVAYVVTNGVSMQPSYHAGDLVVVARSGSYHSGEIVAYHGHQARHGTVLHRIIGGDSTAFSVKGDNNQSVDPTRPSAAEVIGRAVLHLPKVGALLQSPISRGFVAVVVLALLGTMMISPRRDRDGHHAPIQGGGRAIRLWKGLLALDALVLVALALSLVLGRHPSSSPETGPTQTGVLSYHAAVPASDTYPAGEVVTGDPVFVRLLQAVDVSFHYATDASPSSARGTVRLDANLSLANGWHTTLSMAPPTPLVAGAGDITGPLDVARIETLLTSVGKATGLGAAALDVDVVASVDVSVSGAEPVHFQSVLPFQLTALELAPSGPKPSPSPRGPAITATSPVRPSSAAPRRAGTAAHRIRLGLLAVLALAAGSTIVLWPTPVVEEEEPSTIGAPRVRAVDLRLGNLPHVQLADRTALEQLAATLGCPIVEGQDGWAAAVTTNALYWAHTSETAPPEPAAGGIPLTRSGEAA